MISKSQDIVNATPRELAKWSEAVKPLQAR
ncbi:hypothetical protein FHT86_000980 [Rhizobium sp. BK313]|nr:hypothetical protein [Rhizobium sp. BK313]